jgi:phosphoglycolate phosphatase-like HAD superfamily hydrolase
MKPKLLLFDIDGTLISARGIPKIAMGKVLSQKFPDIKYDHSYDFSGRTDPEIIEYLLGYDDIKITDHLEEEILRDFCIELETMFMNNQKPLILPGVYELMKELVLQENVYLGLVTGNISEGARIKLEAAGLYQYFPIGGFGDDSKDRNDLPPIASERASNYYGKDFAARDTWIIGDSIHDIRCAHNNNIRCLAVLTGWTSRETLAAGNPEFLVNDLADSEKIQEILLLK